MYMCNIIHYHKHTSPLTKNDMYTAQFQGSEAQTLGLVRSLYMYVILGKGRGRGIRDVFVSVYIYIHNYCTCVFVLINKGGSNKNTVD